MARIVQFHTQHGVISLEAADPAEPEAAVATIAGRRGVEPMSVGGKTSNVVSKATQTFTDAMVSLKAYAASIEDIIQGLDVTPKEVSIQIGLKFSGSVGFIIAKADTGAEMKVSMKWEPKPKAEA